MPDLEKIDLANGAVVYVRAEPVLDPERSVGALSRIARFEDIGNTISGIAQSVRNGLKEISVNTLTLEFGLEIGFEAGQMISIFAKTSGKADVRVTIELKIDRDK